MSVWVCIPSARPVNEVTDWCERWFRMGYRIALWRDTERIEAADLCVVAPYPGYAKAANALIKMVLDSDAECSWVVATGDDTWPDPNKKAEEIAESCNWHFGSRQSAVNSGDCDPMGYCPTTHTFGVMQPTGDQWSDHQGRIIERIAGSPWIGREFARRMYGGRGPYWEGWWHNWLDEELKLVAESLGVYWMRPDLCHFHDHPLRYPGGRWPDHLQEVSEDYRRMKPVFEARRKAGFPGHEPLAQVGAKA